MSRTRSQLENWLSKIEVCGDLVIDVGGAQKSIISRVKSWQVRHYMILDLPEYDLNKVQKIILNADIVFCLETFEYVFSPLVALNNLNRLLKKGGLLYLSSHFVYPRHEPKGTDFLRYTPEGIKKLLSVSGFEILEDVERRSESSKLKDFYREEGMKMAEGINHDVIGNLLKCKKIK